MTNALSGPSSSLYRRLLAGLSVCLPLLLLAGCSGGPGVGTVTGSVTLDGSPLADADVQFWPEKDLQLGAFGGRTDSKGHFAVTVGSGMRGKPGQYVALITKGANASAGGKTPANEEERVKALMSGGQPGVTQGILHQMYANPKTSPFKVQLKEGANDLEPFKLEKNPKGR